VTISGHLTRDPDLAGMTHTPVTPGVSVSQGDVTTILGGWTLDALSLYREEEVVVSLAVERRLRG